MTDLGTRERAATVADELVAAARTFAGIELPVRVRAWDGSVAGADDPTAPTVVIRSRRALRRLLWNRDELGLARAFVSGDLDVDGDLADGLSRCWAAIRAAQDARATPDGRAAGGDAGRTAAGARRRPAVGDTLRAARTALRWGVVGPRPAPPASEARLGGGLHTRLRDRAAIAHHYDLSNDFYRFLLDDTMAYSCAYWRTVEPLADLPADARADVAPHTAAWSSAWTAGEYGLGEAQRDKLDLVARKLALRPGGRHLDVGCGWGSMVIHAARAHGVRATGITLSAQQRDLVRARVRELGLDDLVEVRLLDYRDARSLASYGEFDTVSSIEMGEHVGQQNYPEYAAILHGALRPGGRLLLQQMSRGTHGSARHAAPGGGAFIERYVAPDMHMRPLGETVGLLEGSGLEVADVHSIREHYVRTVRAWLATLEDHRDEAVRLVGEEQWRVWRLYLAGGALAFEENRMGVHQILAVRPHDDGRSGLPGDRATALGDATGGGGPAGRRAPAVGLDDAS